VSLDENGESTITPADVDGGSFDTEGSPIELSLDKSEFTCADLGENSVTLTATNEEGAPGACTAIVTVIDDTPPVLQCNTSASITPSDAPISFTASASDNCAASPSVTIADSQCFIFTKKGKRIDKAQSCVVNVDSDTITIEDSGGVGDNIVWNAFADDDSGNASEASCSTVVVKPLKL
jgi:hypothetical protein